jgi:putative toxin-antitoxin system antitoxin component (TIGR02293 family)
LSARRKKLEGSREGRRPLPRIGDVAASASRQDKWRALVCRLSPTKGVALSNALQVTALLGGVGVVGRSLSKRLDVVDLVRDGVPYAAFEALTRELSLTAEEACAILRFSPRTMHRRKQSAETRRLDPHESEVVVRVARIVSDAREAFGNVDTARRWLSKPNRALGGRVPIELLDTDVGAQAVSDEIVRIEHGVFS